MKTSLITLTLCLLSSALAADCSAGEYYSSESTTCQQCHISCRSCNSAEGCSSCYDQMYFAPSGNQVVCDLCYNVL